jgi:hypothetical protein
MDATESVRSEDFHVFETAPGVQFHTWNRNGVRDLGAAPNPPAGVRVDYALKSEIKADDEKEEGFGERKTPVKIVVTDAGGRAVATRYGPSKAGLNRYVWDMRYDGEKPVAFQKHPPANEFFTPGEGPRVLPGDYSVAVTVHGKTETRKARVEPDPRIPFNTAEATKGTRAALESRNELTALNEAVNRSHELREELKKIEHLGASDEGDGKESRFPKSAAAAKALEAKLKTWQDSVYNPDKQYDVGSDSIHFHTTLHDSYESLARGLNFATENGPTEATEEEIHRLRGELDPKLADFNRIVADDVAGYNRTAAAEGAPTVWGGDPVKIEAPAI